MTYYQTLQSQVLDYSLCSTRKQVRKHTSMFAILRGSGLHQNLEIDEAKWHKTQSEARHQARKQHQPNHNHNVYVECRRARRFVCHVFSLAPISEDSSCELLVPEYERKFAQKCRWCSTKALISGGRPRSCRRSHRQRIAVQLAMLRRKTVSVINMAFFRRCRCKEEKEECWLSKPNCIDDRLAQLGTQRGQCPSSLSDLEQDTTMMKMIHTVL